jgi:hypothetical protein
MCVWEETAMSEIARNINEEYWRPVQPPRTMMNTVVSEALCTNCGTEYAMGARFCHVCGADREPQMGLGKSAGISRIMDFDQIREKLGLSSASLILFAVGCVCVLAAMFVGLIYTANTVLDWQAVQVWRIEWMLAALVSFVAAILLKKTSA